ncbi:MAG: HD domain-containing phosphohydrolase [Acidobacteriota bacterium]
MTESVRILIVDDEPDAGDMLSPWLEAEGYECVISTNADEALQLLDENDFSVLLATMLGKSSIELLTQTREHYPDVAVIMATNFDDRERAIKSLKMGSYGYVTKPFDQGEVTVNVAKALEWRRLVLASQRYEQRLEEEVQARTAEISRREEDTILRLVWAAECRDQATGDHIRRVGLYAAALAEALGWEQRRVDDIRLAAAMHDIGKIGIVEGILLKAERLTPTEFEVLKKHTEMGAKILEGSDFPLLQMAKEIALCHHERWDGAGYPRGLAGEQIPESARIVAIVDVYDALSHARVYRPAHPEEEVLAIMADGRGEHFDPRIFDCFLDIIPKFLSIRTLVQREGHPFQSRK